MCVKLLIEHKLGFLSLPGGCTGSSESGMKRVLRKSSQVSTEY